MMISTAERDSRLGFSPGKLWSLLDMLKINGPEFCRTLLNINRARLLIEERQSSSADFDAPIDDQKVIGICLSRVKLFRNHAFNLHASVTVSMADEHIAKLRSTLAPSSKELVEDYNKLLSTLEHELSTIFVFSIDSDHKKYFEPNEPLFGVEFAVKFQTMGVFELDEAAKCLALKRPTAAVFHLMRLMEIGIASIAKCLAIPDPIKPAERNWGRILERIDDAIKQKLSAASNRIGRDYDLFRELYASLDAVKNPWRNATMHVENKYTDDEAEHIFIAVKGFMKKLASRMDEDGEPKA